MMTWRPLTPFRGVTDSLWFWNEGMNKMGFCICIVRQGNFNLSQCFCRSMLSFFWFQTLVFSLKLKSLSKPVKFIAIELLGKTFGTQYHCLLKQYSFCFSKCLFCRSDIWSLRSTFYCTKYILCPKNSRWLWHNFTSVPRELNKMDTARALWWLIFKIKDPLHCLKLRMNKMWNMMAVGKYRIE